MRIGISVQSAYPPRTPQRDGARWMIERARVAYAAGLDSLFVGDHHATPIPYYQNVPMLARMLAEWRDRPCGALFLLPLWHPVLLAEQVATLAALTSERFILQCAIGGADAASAALGVNPRHRPSRFEQSIEILRRLWNGETVTHAGRWTLEKARISPLPPEPIAIWIGATAAPAIERAARLGDGWIAGPQVTPHEAQGQLDAYLAACAAADRPRGRAVIRRDVYVGATADRASAVARAAIEAGYRGFRAEALVCGDVDGVTKALSELARMGYDEVLVRSFVPDPDEALASLERLGDVRARLLREHDAVRRSG